MKDNSIIDWVSFGMLLKVARLKNGYSRGQMLCDRIKQTTGLRISERTIYALEDASRSPSADIFIGLQQVLPELRDTEFLKPIFKQSGITITIVEI